MNEGFGAISGLDSLPPSYGEPENVVRLNAAQVNAIPPEGYGIPRQPLPNVGNVVPMGSPEVGAGTDLAGILEGLNLGEVADYGATDEQKAKRKEFMSNFFSSFTSSFTGADGGTTATTGGSSEGFEVLEGKGDKYTYHRFADGRVYVAGPSGKKYVGQTWPASHSGSEQVEKWYGPYKGTSPTVGTAQVTGRGSTAGSTAAQAVQSLLPALASILGPTQITPVEPEYAPMTGDDSYESGAGSKIPWGIIAAGVGVVGVLGGVIWLATRDGDEGEEPMKQLA
jgi:hypothetical protein